MAVDPVSKHPAAAAVPKFEVGAENTYESKDKNGAWWKVTLLDYHTSDNTYEAKVHDGTARVWGVVFEKNIRLLAPRPPPLDSDLLWDRGKNILVLNASQDHAIRLSRHESGIGIVIPTHTKDGVVVYTRATRYFPENARAYVLLGSSEPNASFKITMPTPQHAIYPLMRMLFEASAVEHNLGPEPPDTVDDWAKHMSKKGLVYWHNVATKVNVWKEPSEEPAPLAFEKQIELAIAQSMADGIPRDKSESDAEKERLLDRLQGLGYEEIPVAQDGNCQFRSVAHCVKEDNNQHSVVRREVIDYIRKHRDVYINFVDEDLGQYCEQMLAGNKWGDHITLVAAANLYNIKIEIVASNEIGCKTIMPRDAEGTIAHPKYELVVSYLAEPNAMHYNPCGKICENTTV